MLNPCLHNTRCKVLYVQAWEPPCNHPSGSSSRRRRKAHFHPSDSSFGSSSRHYFCPHTQSQFENKISEYWLIKTPLTKTLQLPDEKSFQDLPSLTIIASTSRTSKRREDLPVSVSKNVTTIRDLWSCLLGRDEMTIDFLADYGFRRLVNTDLNFGFDAKRHNCHNMRQVQLLGPDRWDANELAGGVDNLRQVRISRISQGGPVCITRCRIVWDLLRQMRTTAGLFEVWD